MAIQKLEGHYAIVAVAKNHPDIVLVTSLKNPAIVGLTPTASYVSSDIPGLLTHTNIIYRLENYEFAVLGKGTC